MMVPDKRSLFGIFYKRDVEAWRGAAAFRRIAGAVRMETLGDADGLYGIRSGQFW